MKSSKDMSKFTKKFNDAVKLKTQLETRLNTHKNNIQFFKDSGNCPTCKQDIDEEHAKAQAEAINEEVNKIIEAQVDLADKIAQYDDKMKSIANDAKNASKLYEQILTNNVRLKQLKGDLGTLKITLNKESNVHTLLEQNQKDLKTVTDELAAIEENKKKLSEDRAYIDSALLILKDNGIKSKIIKQHIPMINKQINKHLTDMGFIINFHIDENFNETIKSRHRDGFSYGSFSEGQKTRIDLALLFAWRAIAKQKNSVNCNILFFDETLDSSLDVDGIDEFVRIMNVMAGSANIFVISPRAEHLVDKFQKVYTFTQTKNFCVMKEKV